MLFIATVRKDSRLHQDLIKSRHPEYILDGNTFLKVNDTFICLNTANLKTALINYMDCIDVAGFSYERAPEWVKLLFNDFSWPTIQ